MTCTIRPVQITDAAAIAALLNPIIIAGKYTVMDRPLTLAEEEAFIRTFPQRGVFLAAVNEIDGGLLGIQDVVPVGDGVVFAHVGVISTFVSLNAHRQGAGQSLCRAMFAAARARGFRKISASVRADNPAAVAFYQSQGFAIIGTARQQALIQGAYIDEVLMERFLYEDGPPTYQ